MKAICKDLQDEYEALDEIVAGLSPAGWEVITPFYGWRIKDQISHLAYFDRAARLSATDAAAFLDEMKKMNAGVSHPDAFHQKVNAIGGKMSSAELLSWWRAERGMLVEAFESMDPKARLFWYGPTMSAQSSTTARLMETWAHGQDIADALKISRPATDRLRHIAHIGVSTLGWSFKNRRLAVPDIPIRVSLSGPSGDSWSWVPKGARDSVRGSAEDFCLVVTQRRHPDDTEIETAGDTAAQWMKVAQAFAGPPESAPAPGARGIKAES